MDQPSLQTERLILRGFRLEDAARVQELAGNEAVADTTLTIPHPYPDGAAAAWIATHAELWAAGLGVIYAMVLRDEQRVIGSISLSISPKHQRAEIGYWVGPAYWNAGYCTEAGRAVIALGFGALKLHRIDARHYARNGASGRVMQKLGMQKEGVQREALRKGDRFEDLVLYALLATDTDTLRR